MNRLLFIMIFIMGSLFVAWITKPHLDNKKRWIWTWAGLSLLVVWLLVLIWYFLNQSTISAWFLTVFTFALFINIRVILIDKKPILINLIISSLLACLVSGFCMAINTWESRFSEEEFFNAIQSLILGVYWIFLIVCFRFIPAHRIIRGFPIPKQFWWTTICLGSIGVFTWMIINYRNSFYPKIVPTYPEISEENPFLCESLPGNDHEYEGSEVFANYIDLVEANPKATVPQSGFLVLATGEDEWKEVFKNQLLAEVRSSQFTRPSQSVKYNQYEAALRVYYYANINLKYPDLFTPGEKDQIVNWFNAINQHAQRIEWVDILYGLAFSKFPEGLYENQETGAGLLSILESYQLADTKLKTKNLDYLNKDIRGWSQRFRNTDDSIFYQPQWMDSAFFQSLFYKNTNLTNLKKSMDWLLLQSLPDGFPLRYNQPSPTDIAGTAYRAALQTNDPAYLWLSGRAMDFLQSSDGFLSPRPGTEEKLSLKGTSPNLGSCLIFGNSGLPNQNGPLSPDKIVFRGGWETNDPYLLLNLRFTGWHRYKATNSIILIYQNGPLAIEEIDGELFNWLPEGRSLFRDKRIPRENLNSFTISRSGMNSIIAYLTGIGGEWAQDPPYYAKINEFTTSADYVRSVTEINNWRGWQQLREVIFYKEGPIIIHDTAKGPSNGKAAIFWHIPGSNSIVNNGLTIRNDLDSAEVLFLPITVGDLSAAKVEGESSTRVQFITNKTGRLEIVTIYYFNQWVGADAWVDQNQGVAMLHIQKNGQQIDHELTSLLK